MNILLIAYYYSPLEGAGVTRALQMAKYLRTAGHKVSVLTYSYAGDRIGGEGLFRIHDAGFNRRRTGFRGFAWLGRRLWCEASNRIGIHASIYDAWKRRVLAHGDEILNIIRPDALLATYPPVESLEIALRLTHDRGIPLIADFRDGLLFEPIESKKMSRFACVGRAYAKIEAEIAARASVLVTVSDPLSRYFRDHYGHERVITVANGFDPEENAMTLPEVTLEPGCFHVVHTGRFALSDAGCDIAPLVEALQGLLAARSELARTLRLHLLGDLARRERKLLAPLEECGLVRVHGAVDRAQALAFQRRADLLLLVTDPNRRSVASTKIFEYLQARRPILALTGPTFAAEIVAKTRSGWVVSPLAAKEIRNILERLIDDPNLDQKVDLSPAAIAAYSFPTALTRLSESLGAMERPGPLPKPDSRNSPGRV